MSNTTEKLTEAATEFNNNNPAGMQLQTIFDALKKRPLFGNDFESAKSATVAMAESMQAMLFRTASDSADEVSGQHSRERKFRFFYSYMAPYIDEKYKRDLVAVVDRIDISWREYFRCLKVLPFSIDSSKTEFQYIKKTANVLRYSSEDVVNAALLALPLCKALAPYLDDESSSIPIAIPHSHGCFVGTAVKTLPDNVQDMTTIWKASRTPVRGKANTINSNEGCLTFGAAIRINKSIGFREFDDSHNLTYDLLRPLQEDNRQKGKLERGVGIYSWGPMHENKVPLQDRQAWNEVCDEVRKAVEILIGRPDRKFHGIFTLPLAS